MSEDLWNVWDIYIAISYNWSIGRIIWRRPEKSRERRAPSY